jgi:hypothetical protein
MSDAYYERKLLCKLHIYVSELELPVLQFLYGAAAAVCAFYCNTKVVRITWTFIVDS